MGSVVIHDEQQSILRIEPVGYTHKQPRYLQGVLNPDFYVLTWVRGMLFRQKKDFLFLLKEKKCFYT